MTWTHTWTTSHSLSRNLISRERFTLVTQLVVVKPPATLLATEKAEKQPDWVLRLRSAVGNAIFALMGKRARQLPFSKALA